MKNQFLFISLICSMSLHAQTDDEIARADREASMQETHLQDAMPLLSGSSLSNARFDPSGVFVGFESQDRNLHIDATDCKNLYRINIHESSIRPELMSETELVSSSPNFISPDQLIFAAGKTEPSECARIIEKKEELLWSLPSSFDIYMKDLIMDETKKLTDNDFYESEISYSMDANRIIYTSRENGDLELFIFDLETQDKIQVTDKLGYEGHASFSPDGEHIVFQAYYPETKAEIKAYEKLLEMDKIDPSKMEIYTCDIDGENVKKLTNLGKQNWTPVYHPSGEKIFFSSNHESADGSSFQIYSMLKDGSELEKITYASDFNAYPNFTPDGQYIIFSSHRFSPLGRPQTNLIKAIYEE